MCACVCVRKDTSTLRGEWAVRGGGSSHNIYPSSVPLSIFISFAFLIAKGFWRGFGSVRFGRKSDPPCFSTPDVARGPRANMLLLCLCAVSVGPCCKGGRRLLCYGKGGTSTRCALNAWESDEWDGRWCNVWSGVVCELQLGSVSPYTCWAAGAVSVHANWTINWKKGCLSSICHLFIYSSEVPQCREIDK